jgi:two-component system OmpR family sensor kinase
MIPRKVELPLAVHVLLVILSGLVVSNALFVIVAFTLPPPEPPLYRLAEIAAAFRSDEGALAGQGGFRSEVRTDLKLPTPDSPPERLAQFRLARLLGKPVSAVQFLETERLGPLEHRRMTDFHRFQPRMHRMGPPPGGDPGPEGGPPESHMMSGPGHGEPDTWFRVRRFVAAVQQADGRWLVVTPNPEPFPNPWQLRLLIWMAACLVVLSGVAWLFARRLIAPISAFAVAAERLGRDPSSPPMQLKGPAEIGQAARAFNDMQFRLQRYIQDRSVLLAALAHDLRTPLTRLRFRMETTPEPVRGAALTDIEEMEAMVTGVMAFMRDSSQPRDLKRLDLASLLEATVDDLSLSLKGITLTDLPSRPGVIQGDPVALRRLFDNLISNAVKYGKLARVTVKFAGSNAVIQVDDDGPGIDETDLDRVFEPFYRVDRSRNRETGGMGLGLAVVRGIARAHGGEAVLRNRPGGGLTAEVTLPLAEPID